MGYITSPSISFEEFVRRVRRHRDCDVLDAAAVASVALTNHHYGRGPQPPSTALAALEEVCGPIEVLGPPEGLCPVFKYYQAISGQHRLGGVPGGGGGAGEVPAPAHHRNLEPDRQRRLPGEHVGG